MKEMSKRRKIFSIGLLVVVLLMVIGATASPDDTQTDNKATETPKAVDAPEAVEAPKEEEKVPAEYKSALSKANIYAKTMNMSKQSIHDQLVADYGEKFSAEAAQYAMDNIKADWNKNALAKAKIYQDTMSMSPAAIRDQLVASYGEKFTEAEADYAMAHLND